MTSMQDVCLPWARRGPRTRGGRGAGAHGESVIQSTAAPLTATLEPLTAAGGRRRREDTALLRREGDAWGPLPQPAAVGGHPRARAERRAPCARRGGREAVVARTYGEGRGVSD